MKIEKEISYWSMALYRLVKEKPKDIDKILGNLKKALGKKQIHIPAILKKFIIIYLKENRADLFLAKDSSNKMKDEIKEKIKKELGGNAEIKYFIDESLLAGFRLKTKDTLVKASLKDVLDEVKNKTYGYN